MALGWGPVSSDPEGVYDEPAPLFRPTPARPSARRSASACDTRCPASRNPPVAATDGRGPEPATNLLTLTIRRLAACDCAISWSMKTLGWRRSSAACGGMPPHLTCASTSTRPAALLCGTRCTRRLYSVAAWGEQ